MTARNYSSNVAEKSLTAIMLSNATTLSINSTIGLPAAPFTLVIEPDTANEEIVTVTLVNGLTLTVTRGTTGGDGSSAIEHASGSKVRHMLSSRDVQEPQNHIEASTAYSIKNPGDDSGVTTSTITKSLHGIGSGEGAVVGTLKTQTLTNKTLTSPTISNPTISGTITGTGVVSSTNILDGTIVNDDINASAAIVATKLTGTTSQFNTALSDGDFATLAGTETLTNKTVNLTNNTLTGTTAQFNTALSDNDFATLAGAETLTNKKLTNPWFYQASPFTSSTVYNSANSIANPLTAANLETRVLRFTGTSSADHYWTTPSGTALDTYFSSAAAGDAFDFCIISNNTNGTPGILYLQVGTGVTAYGFRGVFAADTGGIFRLHKTGTAAWSLYRLA